MAVHLNARECYICINHQDKYRLAFILCFTFSNRKCRFVAFEKTCIVPGAGKAILHKSLSSLSLLFSFISIDFPPFPHIHDKGVIPSLHMHARSLRIYLPGVQLSMLALKAPHGTLLLSHKNIIMLKDRDHEQNLCSLMAACSDFTGTVHLGLRKMNSDFQNVHR